MLFYRQKSKVQDKTSGRVRKGPKREKTGMRQAPAGRLTDHTGGRCERRTPTPRGEKTRSDLVRTRWLLVFSRSDLVGGKVRPCSAAARPALPGAGLGQKNAPVSACMMAETGADWLRAGGYLTCRRTEAVRSPSDSALTVMGPVAPGRARTMTRASPL